MAKFRPKVPVAVKQRLVEESGGKCSNPGCANRRTELHHIREWAVYATHHDSEMIAICPACHDAVHHGQLPISDETLYEWKRQPHDTDVRDHVLVAPSEDTKVLLGSIAIASDSPITVFELSEHNRLSFRILDADILLTSLRITSLEGEEVVRVADNHVRHEARKDVTYKRIPGRIEVYVPATEEFLPEWLLLQLRSQDRFFAIGGRAKYFGLRAIRPGVLRVEGVWTQPERAVVITHNALSFCSPSLKRPLTIMGDGEGSVLHWAGPIDSRLFAFGGAPTAV
jgi:hypothetical protein